MIPSICDECGNIHPEDALIASYDLTWDVIRGFAEKKEWALSSKLAMLLIEIGDECSHAYDRAEFFKQFAPKLDAKKAPTKGKGGKC